MDLRLYPLILVFFSLIAVVLVGGCTNSSLNIGNTQLKILDVDSESQSLSSIDVYVTVKNTGSTTANNVVVAAIIVPESDVYSTLENPEILKTIALDDSQNGVLMLDRDFIDALGSGETVKAHLYVNPDDLLNGWDILKVAFADNAEIVYYGQDSSSSIGVSQGTTPYATIPTVTSTTLPEPEYAIGDVINDERNSDVAWVILDYDSQSDEYEEDVIFKWDKYDAGKYGWYPYGATAGTWGYRFDSDSSWFDRDFVEEYYPYILGHVNPDRIPIREDYD